MKIRIQWEWTYNKQKEQKYHRIFFPAMPFFHLHNVGIRQGLISYPSKKYSIEKNQVLFIERSFPILN